MKAALQAEIDQCQALIKQERRLMTDTTADAYAYNGHMAKVEFYKGRKSLAIKLLNDFYA